jgi:hypothetical protein
MFYGLVIQTQGTYTEYQLRQYPQRRQRIEDGGQAVPAAKARPLRPLMRACGHMHAGGVCVVLISAEQARNLTN